MKITIDKDKRITSYAIIGELEGAIEVENFDFEYPLEDYVYSGKKIKYFPNIDRLKKIKREELKIIRDIKVRDNITLYGVEFQVRNEIDIENFKDVERGLNKGFRQLTDKRFWILADNSIKEFTYEQLSKVLDEKAKRKEDIFKKFGELSIKLEVCKTVEEIETIKWE